MADYVIASVAETAIMDVYPYEANSDVKPEFPNASKLTDMEDYISDWFIPMDFGNDMPDEDPDGERCV